MEPANLKFGGGVATTILHPITLIALILTIILIFALRRNYVIVPLLLMMFLFPMSQQIVVGQLHILVLRIVILAGVFKMIVARESRAPSLSAPGLDRLDKIFLLWAFCHIFAFLVLFSFNPSAIVNRLGFLIDSVGGFFLIRYLIQDYEDIELAIKVLSVIALAVALCMLNEHFRFQNVYGYLGGMSFVPQLRDGAVRAQGPFGHPLLAGTFGATLAPLFCLLWKNAKSRLLAAVGVLSSTAMAILAGSTTCLMAYAAGIGAICLWQFRRNMRLMRWGIVAALIGLAFIMKAPVWMLIGHVSIFDSSSTDHRAHLVDLFIRHIGDWWLIGTNSNGSWGWDMWDTSNQFVAEGENAGLVGFISFIAFFVISFSRIGRARQAVRTDRNSEWYMWYLGATLFATLVGFFGISYFDQTSMAWFLLLAMITAATVPVLKPYLAETPLEDAELEPAAPWADSQPSPRISFGADFPDEVAHGRGN